jgi:uncharacterized protein (DUF2164 family)
MSFKQLNVALLSALLLITGSSCAKKTENTTVINNYFTQIEIMTGVFPKLQVEFVDMEPPKVGKCFYGKGIIQLDNTYWAKADDMEREALILHEVGHCTFNLIEHTSSGIMRATVLSSAEYTAHRNELTREWQQQIESKLEHGLPKK